jgi:hypothetical protein
MKKYKKKYYTGGREDYREGGRVGYARGEKVRDGITTIEDKERPGLPPKRSGPVAPPGGPRDGGGIPKKDPVAPPKNPPKVGGPVTPPGGGKVLQLVKNLYKYHLRIYRPSGNWRYSNAS